MMDEERIRTMKKKTVFCACAAILAGALQAFTVTSVSAHQRWPWNTFVDIDFTIGESAADATYQIKVSGTYAGGDRAIAAKTYLTAPVATTGVNRVTWDFGADHPGFKAEDLRISVTATPLDTVTTPVYMVIDLSGGSSATSYPVRYTTDDPVHTPKAEDACKTTQLWLRRIHPAGQQFIFGKTTTPSDSNDAFYAKLTKDYYIGIFEFTQQQWFQVTGAWLSDMSNETWRATRPMDSCYPTRLFGSGGWKWPDNKSVLATSPLGKLRTRSGIAINLPTEAQWQFAANGGATGIDRYRDPNGYIYAIGDIARYKGNAGTYKTDDGWDGLCDADSASACVGTYAPNAYGLYDMLGNAAEDCVEPFATLANLKAYYATFPVENPEGMPQATAQSYHSQGKLRAIMRGDAYISSGTPSLTWRSASYLSYAQDNHATIPYARGFRLCVTCE